MANKVKQDLPDLSRTVRALRAYDRFDDSFSAALDKASSLQAQAMFAKLESLGKAVGHAFGLDTADRNALDTCEKYIRPGFKTPGAGAELSFVRRMVALHESRQLTPSR